MINNLLGQYIYKDSILHNLDPRLKILYVILFGMSVFFINDANKILIFSFLILIIILMSKIRIGKLIIGLKPFYLIFIFIFVMYVTFSRNELLQGLVTIWRFLILIVMSLLLTLTTTISDMVMAIEKLIKPLKILKIKPRNIAVMISITIRFIPVMFLNLEKLKESILARLANFKKFRHMKLIMLILLDRMFKSASNLSDAMQSRLYNETAESDKILKFGKYDYISVAFISIFIFALVIY